MENLYKKIGYKFNNIKLIKQALTHPSINYKKEDIATYERLEFLGDSVLNLIITEYLIKNYLNEDEGKLAKRRAALVSGEMLVNLAREIELGECLIISDSDIALGGRNKDRCLEDAFEALIGAIYLDSGYDNACGVVYRLWQDKFQNMIFPPNDPKSTLQEWAQKNKKPIPRYEIVSATGPAHQPLFEVEVFIEGVPKIVGKGMSRKKAELEAAELMIKKLRI
jgi:ribonuclease III